MFEDQNPQQPNIPNRDASSQTSRDPYLAPFGGSSANAAQAGYQRPRPPQPGGDVSAPQPQPTPQNYQSQPRGLNDLPEDIFAGSPGTGAQNAQPASSQEMYPPATGAPPAYPSHTDYQNPPQQGMSAEPISVPGAPLMQDQMQAMPLDSQPSVVSSMPEPLESRGGGKRKMVVFILSAFIIALLIVAGWLVYRIIVAQEGLDFLKWGGSDNPPSNTQEEPNALQNPDETNQPNAPDAPDQPDTRNGTTPPDQPLPPVSPPPDDSAQPVNPDDVLPTPNNPVPSTPSTDEPDDDPSDSPSDTPNDGDPTSFPPVVEPLDSDGDGLTDLEELELNSNPRVIDTDRDGLDDYTEVMIYKTNPTVADTDGDGYSDLEEIQNGYNPNGPGKL